MISRANSASVARRFGRVVKDVPCTGYIVHCMCQSSLFTCTPEIPAACTMRVIVLQTVDCV